MKPSPRQLRQRRLGRLAGLLMGRPRCQRPTPAGLYRQDFRTAARKIGLRVSTRLRNACRRRWIQLKD